MAYSISQLELKAAAQKLPPSPQIFAKLTRLLKDRNTVSKDIVELVKTDASLTAKVLKISNSMAFSLGQPVDTLEQAVGRVGFAELFKVVGMAAASNVFARRNETYGIDGWLFWENAVATGLAMEALAKARGLDEKEAYTLGLLKTMGKTIIDACSQKFMVPPRFSAKEETPLLLWEEENLGVTNPEAAAIVLDAWNFPEGAIEALRYQYTPDEAPEKNVHAYLLALSGAIAEHLGRGTPGEKSYWTITQGRLKESGLDIKDVRAALQEVKQRLEKLSEELAA
ncbi:HDOD domain-containing protein [Pelagicoccus sp. NFK12]|uniref:HDOD domain-containing protein n=1 Tax=Pelagicoccus enzymogenes TaxID=2773457 RepID=A0A927FFA0_9BACT|nr:HDOD domain-containing protein [Pelagicoccus enzymogenes]MBD5782328.1 HDOD domain-containing protein [Pelagicoccus enzymogenes]MDQ8199244.1 HDOD domain-containing protein [Pelagicoccus enzymogenes]